MNYKLNKSYRKFNFYINTIKKLTIFFKWYIENSKFIQTILKNEYIKIDGKFFIDGYKIYDEYEILLYKKVWKIYKLTFNNNEGMQTKNMFIKFIITNATLNNNDFFNMLLIETRIYIHRPIKHENTYIIEQNNDINEKCISICRELNRK